MMNQYQILILASMTMVISLISGCEGDKGQAPSVTAIADSTSHTKDKQIEITVYKSPTCGCCTDWEDHLRDEGFKVTSIDETDMDRIKSSNGVPEHLHSCHTAVIDGYVVEGHVPAADIYRMLKERPEIVGLSAPGMPMKSPGMQQPGLLPQGYSVLAFNKRGESVVFTSY
ncbi:CopG protein [hydrothermal vent metagenome]|uniref:CopG protein n=1 Tax=hydrothermal vent metagenome TaxID=652676 RepID=A0A3B1B4G6_9ZZZZ